MKKTITATVLIQELQPELMQKLGSCIKEYWKDTVRSKLFNELLQVYKSKCFDLDLKYDILVNDCTNTLIVEVHLEFGSVIFVHLYRCGRMLLNSHITANDWLLNLYNTYEARQSEAPNDLEVAQLQKDNQRLLEENETLKCKVNMYLNAKLRNQLKTYLEELDKLEGVEDKNGK